MRFHLLAVAVIAAAMLTACSGQTAHGTFPTIEAPAAMPTGLTGEAAARYVVEQWGKRLQQVSLLAPDAGKQIREKYVGLVSPSLIDRWAKEVPHAPGRAVSSPWPDRIEISDVTQDASGRYVVDGFVILVTSTEATSGGEAGRIPVRMVVEQVDGKWLITGFEQGRTPQ